MAGGECTNGLNPNNATPASGRSMLIRGRSHRTRAVPGYSAAPRAPFRSKGRKARWEGSACRVAERPPCLTGAKLSPDDADVVKGNDVNMCAQVHEKIDAD